MWNRRTFTASSIGALLAGSGVFSRAQAAGGPAKTFEVTKSPAEWKKILNPQQYHVLRDHGTERAFSHPYDKLYEPGMYNCAACDLPLFSSDAKFDSGTGWPSFTSPLDGAVGTRVDRGLLMVRTEVYCAQCGGHLGHVFSDGPRPTGLRYCINGGALRKEPA